MRNTRGRKGVEMSLYGTQNVSNFNDLRELLSRLCQTLSLDGGRGGRTAAQIFICHGVQSEISHQNLKSCNIYVKG
jgi:hypothetical protein